MWDLLGQFSHRWNSRTVKASTWGRLGLFEDKEKAQRSLSVWLRGEEAVAWALDQLEAERRMRWYR